MHRLLMYHFLATFSSINNLKTINIKTNFLHSDLFQVDWHAHIQQEISFYLQCNRTHFSLMNMNLEVIFSNEMRDVNCD